MLRIKEKGKLKNSAQALPMIALALLALTLLTLLILIPQAYAFYSSNGNIESNALAGTLAFNSSSSNLKSTGVAGANPLGNYSANDITGKFVILEAGMYKIPYLVLSLVSPVSSSGTANRNISFAFNVSSSNTIASCQLTLDGTINSTLASVQNSSTNWISTPDVSIGAHDWSIICYENNGTFNSSETRTFTVLAASGFDSQSTNLSQVNISAVSDFTLSKSGIGKIVFPGLTDLSQGYDLESNVKIEGLSIIINSAAIPVLNKSATLTLYNFPYTYGAILKDREICQDCNIISNTEGTIVFSVVGFSNYTATSTAQLRIFDDSDSRTIPVNSENAFYANYTNVSSGEPITATCDLTINSQQNEMSYNSSSGLYYYSELFNESGTKQYDITCSPSLPGFDILSLSDYWTVGGNGSTSFTNITLTGVRSSRRNESAEPPAAVIYQGGNVTNINLTALQTTKTWQGIYGAISHGVTLQGMNGSKFYSWQLAYLAGEVLAVRTLSVDWNSLHCANPTELASEDSALGVNSEDQESIFNTFSNATIIPSFNVAGIPFSSGEGCYATDLYSSQGQTGNFVEVLLHDTNQVVYTGIINRGQQGFDNRSYDFEMLLGQNGHGAEQSTTYYLYVGID